MILAWSLSEIIRYPFYALNLLGYNPYPLLWVRYSAFYVLYIIGASSEAFLSYATLPKSSPIPGKQSWLQGAWKSIDYGRAFLFLIWWPGTYSCFEYHPS
jgi:very-long-chain (3R)-3-hydroxyacyl-CoA dehydratase